MAIKALGPRQNKTLIVFLLLLIGLTSCTTGGRIERLHYEMTRAEVEQVMGTPSGVRSRGKHMVMFYNNHRADFFSSERDDFKVILKDNKTTEWGTGQVVQTYKNTWVLRGNYRTQHRDEAHRQQNKLNREDRRAPHQLEKKRRGRSKGQYQYEDEPVLDEDDWLNPMI